MALRATAFTRRNGLAITVIPAVVLAATAAGCGGGGEDDVGHRRLAALIKLP